MDEEFRPLIPRSSNATVDALVRAAADRRDLRRRISSGDVRRRWPDLAGPRLVKQASTAASPRSTPWSRTPGASGRGRQPARRRADPERHQGLPARRRRRERQPRRGDQPRCARRRAVEALPRRGSRADRGGLAGTRVHRAARRAQPLTSTRSAGSWTIRVLAAAGTARRLDVPRRRPPPPGDFRAIVGISTPPSTPSSGHRSAEAACIETSRGERSSRRWGRLAGDFVALRDALDRCLAAGTACWSTTRRPRDHRGGGAGHPGPTGASTRATSGPSWTA